MIVASRAVVGCALVVVRAWRKTVHGRPGAKKPRRSNERRGIALHRRSGGDTEHPEKQAYADAVVGSNFVVVEEPRRTVAPFVG